MLINLKKSAASMEWNKFTIELKERLPSQIIAACSLECQYQVKAVDNYYVLSLQVQGQLIIECQRCLKPFPYQYQNATELAICNSEEIAEQLMDSYESLVSSSLQLDLQEILTDELHLYVVKSHPLITDCDEQITKIIQEHLDYD